MSAPIPVFDALDQTSTAGAADGALAALAAYNASRSSPSSASDAFEIRPSPDLIGVDDRVYSQIAAAVNSGKRHLMFYGPPGTGKTELAKYVAVLMSSKFVLVTGSSDWTSQDLIGGYQPMGGGQIAFIPGILLQNFDRPFIIDEMNRCDIDKVMGPLFTVLSEGSTTLPYRVDVTKRDSAQFEILGKYKSDAKPPVFSPAPQWRLIATINTVDKSSLYQMSYALSRRFAWIFVDVPSDLHGLVRAFVKTKKQKPITGEGDDATVLGTIWQAVNAARPLGAAPFIDVINFCFTSDPEFDFGVAAGGDHADRDLYLDAFMLYVMPMLDGVGRDQMDAVAKLVVRTLGIESQRASTFEAQMSSIAL